MQFIKKVSLLLVFVFCFGVMTSCSKGSSNSKVTMSTKEIYETAVKGIEMPKLEMVSGSDLDGLLGTKSSDYEEASIYLSNINIKADEIGIFKYSSDEQSAAIDKAIEKRLKDLDATWSRYLPDQYDLVKKAKKFNKGNVKGYIISGEASKILSNIESIK